MDAIELSSSLYDRRRRNYRYYHHNYCYYEILRAFFKMDGLFDLAVNTTDCIPSLVRSIHTDRWFNHPSPSLSYATCVGIVVAVSVVFFVVIVVNYSNIWIYPKLSLTPPKTLVNAIAPNSIYLWKNDFKNDWKENYYPPTHNFFKANSNLAKYI